MRTFLFMVFAILSCSTQAQYIFEPRTYAGTAEITINNDLAASPSPLLQTEPPNFTMLNQALYTDATFEVLNGAFNGTLIVANSDGNLGIESIEAVDRVRVPNVLSNQLTRYETPFRSCAALNNPAICRLSNLNSRFSPTFLRHIGAPRLLLLKPCLNTGQTTCERHKLKLQSQIITTMTTLGAISSTPQITDSTLASPISATGYIQPTTAAFSLSHSTAYLLERRLNRISTFTPNATTALPGTLSPIPITLTNPTDMEVNLLGTTLWVADAGLVKRCTLDSNGNIASNADCPVLQATGDVPQNIDYIRLNPGDKTLIAVSSTSGAIFNCSYTNAQNTAAACVRSVGRALVGAGKPTILPNNRNNDRARIFIPIRNHLALCQLDFAQPRHRCRSIHNFRVPVTAVSSFIAMPPAARTILVGLEHKGPNPSTLLSCQLSRDDEELDADCISATPNALDSQVSSINIL
ncbi:MAG: hypothetical protein P1U61_06135 [Legionellaceae bacterium]|nr:hypothetical protein [Legionellaceae bacterium]